MENQPIQAKTLLFWHR